MSQVSTSARFCRVCLALATPSVNPWTMEHGQNTDELDFDAKVSMGAFMAVRFSLAGRGALWRSNALVVNLDDGENHGTSLGEVRSPANLVELGKGSQRLRVLAVFPTSGRESRMNPSRFGILTRGSVLASITSFSPMMPLRWRR